MNLETRHLGVDADGIYVKPSALSRGETICRFCPLRLDGCDLAPENERCGQFVPALTFVPPLIGLEGSFSTFRPSAIWYDRARQVFKTHKRVALVNATTKELIGFGRVTDAHRGAFSDLMRDHAWTNHLTKDQGMTRDEAATWLRNWIRRNMGSMYVRKPAAIGTVIYVSRD